MARNMSPENSNPKLEGARFLSRQERIAQLRQDEQLKLIIKQRDAVNEFFRGADYDILVGMFVGPDGAVWGIRNRKYGTVPDDWLVVRCASNEDDKNRSEINVENQEIYKVEKTKSEGYSFLPIGVEGVDTLHLAGGGPSINIFWKEDKNKDKDESKSKKLAVAADNRGIEFLPLDEIVDPKIEAEIKANKEADEFDRLVQPLRNEGLGENVKIREGLGASALSDTTLSPASQTR